MTHARGRGLSSGHLASCRERTLLTLSEESSHDIGGSVHVRLSLVTSAPPVGHGYAVTSAPTLPPSSSLMLALTTHVAVNTFRAPLAIGDCAIHIVFGGTFAETVTKLLSALFNSAGQSCCVPHTSSQSFTVPRPGDETVSKPQYATACHPSWRCSPRAVVITSPPPPPLVPPGTCL